MIWRQNDQNFWVRWQNTKVIKLQWIETIWHLNDENFRVTSQNYKSHQITMNCIDLTSKLSKMLSYIAKHSKQSKSTKRIKLQWIASIWCQNDQNNAKLQTRSNYDQFASIWHLNYQKCWVTSQNIQINAKLRKWSNYNGLHRFDGKNIKPTQNYKSDHITMKLHRFDVKTIKTTQNYKTDQIIMYCNDLTSKRSKKLSYVPKHSKQRKTTKLIKL